jgi:succinate dehydrogenase/fumarate reductase flavoprotein subunit/Pyruvate/2-oxoacid:ferredoxin oxidoreductase delta subunit
MSEKDVNLSRRKFIAAGSAVIAAPIVMNMVGRVAEAAEQKSEATSSDKKTYFIDDNCCLCAPMRCKLNCPADAIYHDGEHNAIDTNKCIRCGTCYRVCPVSAVVDASALQTIKPHDTITKECDLLIIGGGSSGLVAATAAADLSHKKIIILEKGKKIGGSGYFANDISVSNSKWHKKAGIADRDLDDAIRSACSNTKYMVNPKLIANFIYGMPAFFDWYCSWGKAEEVFTLTNGELKTRYWETDKLTYLILQLIDKCKEMGVEMLTEHTAKEFILDGDKVAGVKAKDPGGTTIVKAKNILIATGNIINCTPIIQRVVPEYNNCFYRRTGHRLPTNTGDGVVMAEKIGIPIDYNNIVIHHTGANSSFAEVQERLLDTRAEGLFVNYAGERWVNEAYVNTDFLPVLRKQPRSMYYNVMDSKIISMEPLSGFGMSMSAPSGAGGGGAGGMGGGQGGVQGGQAGMAGPAAGMTAAAGGMGGGQGGQGGAPGGMQGGQGGMGGAAAGGMSFMTETRSGKKVNVAEFGGPPGGVKTDLKELERISRLPGKHVIIANTIEELADKMGVEREVLVDTVKRYNELCEKGKDEDFYKPKKYMLPIEKGPFYATSHFLGMDGAFGGLSVNENMQVIGRKGAMDNLFATGDTIGSNHINKGGERLTFVNEMSWAVGSGWVAGEYIGKRLIKS